MEKPASNQYPIHKLIERRWSPRAFSSEPISEEVLYSLFEAARWAPSSYNDQPWYFIVGRKDSDTETYEKVFDSLMEGNQAWADTAPVLGISVARKNFEYNGEPNRHAMHDVGLAMQNLVIQAMDHELFVHQMAGFSTETARDHFNIPQDHEPVAAFAIGRPGEPGDLPEELREQEKSERSRKAVEEFVFTGDWGKSADFVT